MKKLFLFSLVFVLTLSLGYGMAMAGNGAPSGPHYNLNIIGVEKAKNADMTNSHRHTIFVALGKNGAVKTKIYLTEGDFRVCDGNGFDEAYDCDGFVVGKSNGAVFQLPANGCWLDDCVNFDPDSQMYEVYARALGTPGGKVIITTCVETLDGEVCSTENVLLVRKAGPSKFKNVSRELTTIIADFDLDGDTERYGLFEDDAWQYFWDYDNNGCKLVQLRFYDLQ